MTLTVPKDDVAAGYRGMLADYAKNAQLPGFRKGKAPPSVLERKFGEAIRGEALSKIMEGAVEEAFGDESLPRDERPLHYSQPKMESEPRLDLESDLVFSLVYDVAPKVTLGRWKGLEAEVPDAQVAEEDVARELEAVRDRSSFVVDREEGAQARNGDIVTISFCELDESGEPVKDSEREGFAYTLGSKQSPYMFDDDVVGMANGETKEFAKEFPEASEDGGGAQGASPFAGRTIKVRLALTAVKERKLPDLDDELAQDVDAKFETLDDLRKSIRDRLEAGLKARSGSFPWTPCWKREWKTPPSSFRNPW
jgi:trigger factor